MHIYYSNIDNVTHIGMASLLGYNLLQNESQVIIHTSL